MIRQTLGTSIAFVLCAAPIAALAEQKPAEKAAEKKADAAPAAAPAPGGAMPAAPKPAPELDQLKYFEGNWRCDGKAAAGAFAPGSPEVAYKSSFKVKKDLDGFAYAFEYEQKKSKAIPGMKAKGFFAYDPIAKKITSSAVDSMGGSGSDTAAGWEGDKLVFTGEGLMMGQKMKTRSTVTKKGEKEFTYAAEAHTGKAFQAMAEDVCKK